MIKTQKTFVMMKTSWRRLEEVFGFHLQKTSWSRRLYLSYSYVFRKRLHQDQHIRLGHTPSRRLQYVFKTSSRHLQDAFKACSRHLQDVFKMFWKRLQEVFKSSSRRLENVFKTSSKHLQDVLKTHYQVKLFLVIQFQDVFETYSKSFWSTAKTIFYRRFA